MFFVKKEDLDTIRDIDDIFEFMDGLAKLDREGKVKALSVTDESNAAYVMARRLMDKGYEKVHFDIV